MRPLIVLGADEKLKDRLHERWSDVIMFPETRDAALTLLSQHPHALMAYAPGVFGAATQPRVGALVRTPDTANEPQVMLLYADTIPDRSTMELDDPLRFIEGAAHALKVGMVLNLYRDAAMDLLGEILAADNWPSRETA